MSSYNLTGLTTDEVEQNRLCYGINSAEPERRFRNFFLVRDVVTEPLFIMLVMAVFIYFLLGEYTEGVVMILALFFVSGISLYQENRSRNAVNALKKLTSPLCKVIRDGEQREIDSVELVPGDLVLLEDGNIVPADARILEAHDCTVNESILTGESLAVEKSGRDTFNLLFQGTMLLSGSCIGTVTATGKETALGKIGKKLEEMEVEKTPLQLQIRQFVRFMVRVGMVAFVVVWGFNSYRSGSILNGLLHGLTLAMSVLPEEIPVAFSTFMALGAYRLYKMKVIARSPQTVETLGAATVICTDKTGTLTENEMKLSAVYELKGHHLNDFSAGQPVLNKVLEYAMWASEPVPFDRMEKSLHLWYESLAVMDQRNRYQLVHEYPLSGTHPVMTHVFSDSSGDSIIACKGALESLLRQSVLTPEEADRIKGINLELTSKGYRVLAVARGKGDIHHLPLSHQDIPVEILGLVAFHDPPKENIRETLEHFYKAGIQVKMITGDFSETALSIARQVNMKISPNQLTGDEVMTMNDEELRQKAGATTIFARMYPEAKLRVVEALKANGEVVAMTGDGVNDGPALKAAHIGIAMGKRGSEVARSTAAIILSDDNLEHMVQAVMLGRRIYENLKKAIRYIISIHIPIVLIVTLPLLAFWKFKDFFSPIHVIFLELIMGPTCSIIFENEPIEADSMSRKPRKMSSTFFSLRELSISMIQGLFITASCLGLGYYMMHQGCSESKTRTFIYTTLILSNIFLTLVNRSFRYPVWVTLGYKNNLIPLILSVSAVVLTLSLYLQPVRNLFQFELLTPADLSLCLLAAFAGVSWVEVFKWLNKGEKLR